MLIDQRGKFADEPDLDQPASFAAREAERALAVGESDHVAWSHAEQVGGAGRNRIQ